jgi:hypothetical protein
LLDRHAHGHKPTEIAIYKYWTAVINGVVAVPVMTIMV